MPLYNFENLVRKRVQMAQTDVLRIRDVVGGSNFSLALDDNGELYYWGRDLTIFPEGHIIPKPTKLSTPYQAKIITAGNLEYAIVDEDSIVHITGWRWSPVTDYYESFSIILTLPENAAPIAELHLVAAMVLCRTSEGQIWEWKRPFVENLADEYQFVKVDNFPKVSKIALNFFNCAMTRDNDLWVWTTGYSKHAFQIPLRLEDGSKIVSSRYGVITLDTKGTVHYIGERARSDILAHQQPSEFEIIATQPNLPSLRSLYSGQPAGHYLGVADAGDIWGWGRNEQGQLGIGEFSRMESQPPTPALQPYGKVRLISLGAAHSLIIDADEQLWAWGANPDGQLGLGHRENIAEPTRVIIERT